MCCCIEAINLLSGLKTYKNNVIGVKQIAKSQSSDGLGTKVQIINYVAVSRMLQEFGS